ncbi:glycosyltransferase family 4 protein [Natronomonas gomsonensis]|uniref:glycosyltransferase family 4 protein n=1 Tax=Natronomonas gomsonensis TaxID=1046043 RepID=UPI00227A4A62|nr:glycosyltransferase family 1 protein [Natronomonas gomsonensis]MCY4732132.1 glycosyltransferase family 4 protein [Natronomonas gomsonensis]
MKIAINALAFERGGGMTYLKNILPELDTTGDEYYIYVKNDFCGVDESKLNNIEFISIPFSINNLPLRMLFEQMILPFLLFYHRFDVLYTPTGVTSLFAPIPTIIAIRNPNPYHLEKDKRFKLRIRHQVHRFLTQLSIYRSSSVIFVSEYSRDAVRTTLSIDPDKCEVVYHGITIEYFRDKTHFSDENIAKIANYNSPYILCVSTIYKHKNYHTLIKGYARLPEVLREKYPLLIAGSYVNQDYYDSVVHHARELNVDDDINFLGQVDYEDIPPLYNYAAVSVLPSKLETFGHTLVEAMAARIPIVAADSASIPEITGEAACLFDPDDPSELAEHLEKVLTKSEVAADLIAAGDTRVRDFSWEKTAEDTYDILQSVN